MADEPARGEFTPAPPQVVPARAGGYFTLHIGPLPPPEDLEQYDSVVPGYAARLADLHIKQAEQALDLDRDEVSHRHQVERDEQKIFGDDVARQGRIEATGQWLAVCVVPMTFALCAYFAYLGYGVVAGAVAGSVTVSLAAAFIYGRSQRPRILAQPEQSPATEPTDSPPAKPLEPGPAKSAPKAKPTKKK